MQCSNIKSFFDEKPNEDLNKLNDLFKNISIEEKEIFLKNAKKIYNSELSEIINKLESSRQSASQIVSTNNSMIEKYNSMKI